MEPKKGAMTYVADGSVREVFADGFQMIMFDGANLRVELIVGRSGEGGSGTRHPAARLVLTVQLVTELAGHFTKLLADLEQRGALRKNPTANTPAKN